MRPRHATRLGLFVAACLTLSLSAAAQEKKQQGPERWESTIRKFEAADMESPPKKNGVLFVGSSSIRRWDLDESFPGKEYINRGFGGSEVADALYYADRIILPYKPRVIILYAGDNDLARGKEPEKVVNDFQELVDKVHDTLPETRIAFIAVKPSIARWKLADRIRLTNRLVSTLAKQHERIEYVDIFEPMLGDDGKPRADLLADDNLHLSPAGYKLWTRLVSPHLKAGGSGKEPDDSE